jgi:hypothetical protein
MLTISGYPADIHWTRTDCSTICQERKKLRVNLKPIQEQVVVIVGANSDIERETALQFAERGVKVVVAGRSLPALTELVREIELDGSICYNNQK